MRKTELIQALNQSRQQLLKTIEGLPQEMLTQSGACGHWSVKDVLAHLTMWEAETVTFLYQVRLGMKPSTLHPKSFDTDQQNALWYEKSKDRPWERVWEDFRGVRQQTLRRLEAFSDTELNDTKRFSWLKGKCLAEVIQEWVVDHEIEHSRGLEAWRKSLNP